MKLQEINDQLKALAKEIEELEHKNEGDLFLENLLQEQEKLLESVC